MLKAFLEDGDKVKAYVFFKGRSILFKEQGEVLLLRFANDLEDYAKVDQMPVIGRKANDNLSSLRRKRRHLRRAAAPQACRRCCQRLRRLKPKKNKEVSNAIGIVRCHII